MLVAELIQFDNFINRIFLWAFQKQLLSFYLERISKYFCPFVVFSRYRTFSSPFACGACRHTLSLCWWFSISEIDLLPCFRFLRWSETLSLVFSEFSTQVLLFSFHRLRSCSDPPRRMYRYSLSPSISPFVIFLWGRGWILSADRLLPWLEQPSLKLFVFFNWGAPGYGLESLASSLLYNYFSSIIYPQ